MRPALPLPPADEGTPAPGMLLIRTDPDDDAWRDVLHRMGELPGLVTPSPGGEAAVPASGAIPRRLIVVDDPAWWGATPEEVREALHEDGTWVPDLVLMATERTAATPHQRPLRAFRDDGDDDVHLFRITPLQAALAYLVLHLNDVDSTFDDFREWSPIAPEWEPEEGEDLDEWEAGLPDPVGANLERLDPVPRYTPPARPLPLLTQENDGLIVRTDFSDDAAWERLLTMVYHPGNGNPIDDFGDHIDTVHDPVFEGATPEQVLAVLGESPDDAGQPDVVMIADGATMRDPGHPVLIVPVEGRIGCAFRLAPDEVGNLAVNLAIGNMDIEDFMDDETLEAIS